MYALYISVHPYNVTTSFHLLLICKIYSQNHSFIFNTIVESFSVRHKAMKLSFSNVERSHYMGLAITY